MKNLIKKLPELYQDIEVNGKLLAKGRRDCQSRAELILPHISPHSVVMDLGSATGYFAQEIAMTYPDSLVISFESDPVMCEIQKKTFKEEGIYNVVVCQHRLSKKDLEKWVEHVELFDTILALSVLHHYPANDVDEVCKCLEELSEMVIVEIPATGEKKACGGEAKKKARDIWDEKEGEWLGDTRSHLGKYNREICLYKNTTERKFLDAFFGVSHPDRHRFTVKDSKINGKHIIKGINVWNLSHFDIVWPLPKWWQVQSRAAYECLEFKSDVRPWNLLVTSTGLKAIDYMTKFPKGDQAEFREEDYERLNK